MQNPTSKPDAAKRAASAPKTEAAPAKVRKPPAGYPVPRAQVTLRLSQPLIDRLKATGPGWVSRLEQTIEQWAQPKR